MVEVAFTQVQPWALVPQPHRVDRKAARDERDLYQDHFRYKRITRLPVECPPWVLGQELGWMIRSPVTMRMTPVEDIDFSMPEEEDLRPVASKIGRSELWRRGTDWIATRDTDWLRFHDFQTSAGWESMFLPNGYGTVEWRLGWSVRVPDRYFVLVIGGPIAELEVPVGVIPAKTVNAMTSQGGFSIAVAPRHPVSIRRGDPIARLVLLHPDSLQAAVAAPEASDA
ncbi:MULTISPECIES: hypothetical protein [unclassified Micromonospora]|uniref:hypothetical protein n=1 Tax=unclassified Micromonospora TaxID=2617518 RepID=UPI002417CB67|nr:MULTISPECIES: hypothetical protein [unclassified Micromonospora]MDG4817008.1 hypothetical protein [Micromonospora sp. WMMD956]WFE59584.1 hypothetical protein O7633_23235 [Micromonospora sp. WMMD712]